MKKRRDQRPYVGLHKQLIFRCPEWAELSSNARSLYILLKGKRNPAKYGDEVSLSYRQIKKLRYRGLKRTTTISTAFRELEKGGWIKRKDEGGGLFRKATVYLMTGKFDEFGF